MLFLPGKDPDKQLAEIIVKTHKKIQQGIKVKGYGRCKFWLGNGRNLDDDVWEKITQIFPETSEHVVGHLNLFERNDTDVVQRADTHCGSVSLPSLYLELEDLECLGSWYCGFIDGRKNIETIIRMVAKELEI